MNYFEAGDLKRRARASGIRADLMGVPHRPGYGVNERPSNTVVFWVLKSGEYFDYEFSEVDKAEEFLAELIRQQGKQAATG